MDNIAGTPVEGEDFFGRTAEIAHLVSLLLNHDILLLGPRRIGKTSIARAVMAQVRTDGWYAIEINVAACRDEKDFLDKLNTALTPELASIASKAKTVLHDTWTALTGRIKSIKIPIPGAGPLDMGLGDATTEEWSKVASDVVRLLGQAKQSWLIYVDELPIFLFNIIRNDTQHGVQRVRRFLDWFRNDVCALPDAHQVRWLVSGSVGLDTLVQQHGMADTINSMNHQTLAAFEDDVAIELLATLAARYKVALTADNARSIVAAVQWSQPYYLQMAFSHLRGLMASNNNTSLQTLIEKALDQLAQPGSDNDFHHWETRLFQQLSHTDASHALSMLNLAARTTQGERPETMLAALEERIPNTAPEDARRIFINLRDILQRDAYWIADESAGVKRYRFRLEPLRRWWLRRDTL